MRHGKGKMTFSNGDQYNGRWLHDQQTKGEYTTSADNSVYSGYFKDDTYNGRGRIKYSDGVEYRGNWVSGIKDGNFDIKIPGANGGICKGRYSNGQSDGDWVCSYDNGDNYTGQLYNEKPHGYGKFTANDGTILEGNWELGELIEPMTQLSSPESPEFTVFGNRRPRTTRRSRPTARSRSSQGGKRSRKKRTSRV